MSIDGNLTRYLQANTFILTLPMIRHVVEDYPNTVIMNETVRPYLLFRSLRIRLNQYNPDTPPGTSRELGKVLSCDHLDRLEIKIFIPISVEKHPEDWAITAAKAIAPVVHQLREKFGTALKVLIGPSSVVGEENDITWLWTKPDSELVGKVTRGEGSESEDAWVDVWQAWR